MMKNLTDKQQIKEKERQDKKQLSKDLEVNFGLRKTIYKKHNGDDHQTFEQKNKNFLFVEQVNRDQYSKRMGEALKRQQEYQKKIAELEMHEQHLVGRLKTTTQT